MHSCNKYADSSIPFLCERLHTHWRTVQQIHQGHGHGMLRKVELWADITTSSLQTNRGALGFLLAQWKMNTHRGSNNLSRFIYLFNLYRQLPTLGGVGLFFCKEINPDGLSCPVVCCHSASVVFACWYHIDNKASLASLAPVQRPLCISRPTCPSPKEPEFWHGWKSNAKMDLHRFRGILILSLPAMVNW